VRENFFNLTRAAQLRYFRKNRVAESMPSRCPLRDVKGDAPGTKVGVREDSCLRSALLPTAEQPLPGSKLAEVIRP
jgi:hypothetical protein